MSLLKRIRFALEVMLTRAGIAIVPRFPRPLLVRIARILGWAGYYLAPSQRRIGESNLDLAFGDSLTRSRKEQILKTSFQTFALVLLDILWFTRDSAARLQRHVHFDEATGRDVFIDKTQLCVTGHLGNWETLGQAISAQGHPVHSVAAPLKNPGVEALFTPLRQKTGQVILHKEGVIRSLLSVLRQGKKVGILLDQNTPPSEGGLFVPFFGRPVPVATAPAALALRVGCELPFLFCTPTPGGDYKAFLATVLPASPPTKSPDTKAVDRLTAEILHTIEDVVRKNPDHWIWMYKRWKFIAPGHTADAYPPYAKPLERPADIEKARVYDPAAQEA